MKKLITLLMLLFISAGCASVSVQRYYKDVIYPATNPANVAIFMEKPSGKKFIELGEITVTGASDWNQVDKIFKAKAAEMGGDAVYVFSQQQQSRQYVSPDECYVSYGYYYPYHHFGWHHYGSYYYYPRGYYYCYGYPPSVETVTYLSVVGIVIKYIQ